SFVLAMLIFRPELLCVLIVNCESKLEGLRLYLDLSELALVEPPDSPDLEEELSARFGAEEAELISGDELTCPELIEMAGRPAGTLPSPPAFCRNRSTTAVRDPFLSVF